ncbi:MAG: hypothetical protein LBM78_02625, partial [Clostridiales bacterium]|nr:hypothetical protein [Clostridiales bacterium]
MPVTNEKTIGAATPRKARRSVPVLTVILCATLVLYALALVVLMVWGFISSLKGNLDFNGNPFGLPEVWKFDNYVVALRLFFVKIQHGAGFRTVYIEE